nr:hypothetical protein [Geotalea toluenoxydans]
MSTRPAEIYVEREIFLLLPPPRCWNVLIGNRGLRIGKDNFQIIAGA